MDCASWSFIAQRPAQHASWLWLGQAGEHSRWGWQEQQGEGQARRLQGMMQQGGVHQRRPRAKEHRQGIKHQCQRVEGKEHLRRRRQPC